MGCEEVEFETIRKRVEKLERTNRVSLVLSLLLLCSIFFALSSWRNGNEVHAVAQTQGSRVVSAGAFILEDESGKTRAELSMSPVNTPRLRFFDKSGLESASLDGENLKL